MENDARTLEAAQTNAFSFSYIPGEGESFEDVVDLMNRVFPGEGSIGTRYRLWLVEAVCEQQTMVLVIVCAANRVRVRFSLSHEKWARKGARGEVRDVKWPEPHEVSIEFLRRRADAMKAEPLRNSLGSESDLARLLTLHYDRERERMRAHRNLKSGKRRNQVRPPRAMAEAATQQPQASFIPAPPCVQGNSPYGSQQAPDTRILSQQD